MPNIGGGEFLLLIVLALVILGPDKLPQYAAKLAQFVRSARDMAEGAKTQIREEMGPGFDDVDWRALDPRQYDPRRIMREALSGTDPRADDHEGSAPTETTAGRAANEAAIAGGGVPGRQVQDHDPSLPTPWDVDAT
ncbi:Sec-independent protein translocase TatB [Ornithinimicrobium ciconiae]|uniref:Sec-independent protein translocase TatB n=1 Tax=Ornithinimicrobium ciconiae TaxID=2594265 RepID=A0A516G8N6_9MICO|nr:Sec-independent protein translocase TatB [Ornithinimicrobium ciconiae]QDO87896.1 Sec-independent protein translocase TatB [Ornithinimicrobium ciconiae]